MKNYGNKAKDLKICYIGGGSRGWAWSLMSDLALQDTISGTVALYDIDREAAEANEVIGNRISAMPEAKSMWKYEAVHDIGAALRGADFVIISIMPADFEEMASDVHAPEKYGIYQSVGDTTGPGGLFRALRTIPMYVVIAEAIKEFAPDAWVINYTNPMALCMATLYEVFPGIKAFGCCHEVFGTQKLFARTAEEMLGIENVSREDININVLGINHFTWIDRASLRGTDLMPVYKDFARKHSVMQGEGGGAGKAAEAGIEIEEGNLNAFFKCRNLVKFDLLQRFGIAAAAGDRHLAEFVPWYLEGRDTCEKWGFALTPVSWRVEARKMRIEKSRQYASGELPVELRTSGEDGVKQMVALLGLGDIITNVNMPNIGQMSGLRHGAIVETNAVFRKNEARPVMAGALPAAVNLLILRHTDVHAAVLKAALEKDKDLAFWAFTQDPLTTKLTLNDATALFEEMLENTKSYLPF